jgi:hypothetical protein
VETCEEEEAFASEDGQGILPLLRKLLLQLCCSSAAVAPSLRITPSLRILQAQEGEVVPKALHELLPHMKSSE